MAGRISDIRIVTFKSDFGRYKKGDHAMHKSLAEKLNKRKAPISIKKAEPDVKKLEEKLRAKAEKQKEKVD